MHPIERTPKAELHLHIEGSLEPAMVMDFVARNRLDFIHASEHDIRTTYEFPNLAGFSAIYQINAATLTTERDYYDLAYAYMRRTRVDQVLHAEVAMSPQAPHHRGISAEMAVEGVLAGLEAGKRDFGMTGGLIVGCQRNRGPEDGMRMLRQMAPYRDRILGLGLHSAEVGYPPAPFAAMFDAARDWGWHTVAHAGEEGPPEYIWEALDVLKVERIDHGVRCEEDPRLMRRLAEDQIPLTVCPMSNVCLKVFPRMADHNVARLLRAGLMVTVNSDDPPYFGGYANVNYTEPARHLGLSGDELVTLARNSFKAAFLSPAEKARYLAAIDAARPDACMEGGA